MAKYTLTDKAYLGDNLYMAGDTIETDLAPGAHMVPYVDDKGREDKDARKAKDAAAKANPAAAPGDPRYIGDLIEHSLMDGTTAGRVNAASSIQGSATPNTPGLGVDPQSGMRGVPE